MLPVPMFLLAVYVFLLPPSTCGLVFGALGFVLSLLMGFHEYARCGALVAIFTAMACESIVINCAMLMGLKLYYTMTLAVLAKPACSCKPLKLLLV